jgi:dihydrolipoamide dehydrogenase
MNTFEVDITILGCGPGGYAAAIRASKKGFSVAVVEKGNPGGVCLNNGCIPTKALYYTARTLEEIRKAGNFGIDVSAPVLDFGKVMARKDRIISNLRKSLENDFSKNNIKLIKGRGEIAEKGKIIVEASDDKKIEIKTRNIIVATGSSAANVKPFELSEDGVLDNVGILSIEEIPESLLIIGGGVIGCEFANIFSSFSPAVTVVEMLPGILSTEDEEISKIIQRVFREKNVNIFTNSKVDSFKKSNKNFECTISGGHSVSVDKVLISAGRKPNSNNIGLGNVGVGMDRNGYIKVSPYLKTSVDGIYAIGDVTGGSQYAHVASMEGEIAVENIAGRAEEMSYNAIPRAIFTSPEISAVGLTENQAKEKNIDVCTGIFPFSSSSKAYIADETEGFIKIIADSKTREILGAHIVGPGASDLIHEVAVAMKGELLVDDLASTVHAHPTFSEAVMEAAKKCSETIESK